MSQFDVTTLTDITSSTANIAAGLTNSASDVTTWMTEAAADLAALNDAAQAIATSQSAATAPATNRQGEIFFDTDTSYWLGDPDGSGHDDEFLTRLTAYNHALATGGTATHKLMGRLHTDTTADSLSTAGDFTAYTLPANTLSANGQAVRVTWWGTKTGTNTAFSLQPKYGSTNYGTAMNTVGTAAYTWTVQCLIVRTAAATQDVFFHVVLSADNAASTTLASFDDTGTEDFTTALDIALDCTVVHASDAVIQQGFIVELMQ